MRLGAPFAPASTRRYRAGHKWRMPLPGTQSTRPVRTHCSLRVGTGDESILSVPFHVKRPGVPPGGVRSLRVAEYRR